MKALDREEGSCVEGGIALEASGRKPSGGRYLIVWAIGSILLLGITYLIGDSNQNEEESRRRERSFL